MIEVPHEDEQCIVICKPENLLVHHSHYARNIEEDSLVQILKEQLGFPVFPVHRLDRKTSGVLLLVKDKMLVSQFQQLFENKEISKKYLALLRGFTEPEGTIDSPVKNDRGNYREALTNYRTLRQFIFHIPVKPYDHARYSLVEFSPVTGRMHQLRIHANKISHPIIGDPKYGNRHHNHMFAEDLKTETLFLHAVSLEFVQPVTNEKIKIEAGFPEFWNAFFDHPKLEEQFPASQ